MTRETTSTEDIITHAVALDADALDAEFLAPWQAAVEAHERAQEASEERLGLPRLSRVIERSGNRLFRWTAQLADMQPQSLAGLAAKGEALLALGARVGNTLDEAESHLVLSLAHDVVRIATHPAAGSPMPTDHPGPDPFPDMFRRAGELRAAGNAAEDGACEAIYDQLNQVEEQAIATRPSTLEGAVASLEWCRAEHCDFSMQDPNRDDHLMMALLDGAIGVLRGVVGIPAAETHLDAELLALASLWETSRSRCDATTAAYDKATERLQAVALPIPEVLFRDDQDHKLLGPYGSDHSPSGRRWYGDPASIAALRQGCPAAAGEDRRTEIVEAYDLWQAERWAIELASGYVVARDADVEAGKENRVLRQAILAKPARTMHGILLKARVARWCFMDDEDEIARHLVEEARDSSAAGETAAFSILLDLVRMLPGAAQAAAPQAVERRVA